jgi:hypothetical protein
VGSPSANLNSKKLVLPKLFVMTDRTRATYSRRAAPKNSEIKKDEQSVIEKVVLSLCFHIPCSPVFPFHEFVFGL